MIYLDFEKPIEELEEQITKTRQIGEKGSVDMTSAVEELQSKLNDLKVEIYSHLSGWQRVQLSRHPERPYTIFYIEHICNNFIELHGDRHMGDDKAIVGGLGEIDGQSVMIIGHQKGSNTKQRQYRNFGMANPEGYRKALRLMKMAEKFNIPIITLIDTPGAFPGLEAEERGQAEAIARNLYEMFLLKVPVICVVIGEGASGGAIGIGVGDKVLMLENTWYSVISPESCSSILWHNWDSKEIAAEQLKLTSKDMFAARLVDGIIKEPLGGAHNAPLLMVETLKNELVKYLAQLNSMDAQARIDRRIEKFSKMGIVESTLKPVAV